MNFTFIILFKNCVKSLGFFFLLIEKVILDFFFEGNNLRYNSRIYLSNGKNYQCLEFIFNIGTQ